MLLEFLEHAMAFDLNWIAMLILGNLHWVFALLAFTVIAEKGKRPVWHFLLIVAMLYAFVDILGIAQWLLVPFILAVPFQLVVGTYFPEGTWPHKHFAIIVVIYLLLMTYINTFWFRFPGA